MLAALWLRHWTHALAHSVQGHVFDLFSHSGEQSPAGRHSDCAEQAGYSGHTDTRSLAEHAGTA